MAATLLALMAGLLTARNVLLLAATALSCLRLALSRLVYGMMLCEPPNLAER